MKDSLLNARLARRIVALLGLFALLVVPCMGAPNQFVILSDTQNIDGVDQMTREIIALDVPVAISVGDVPSSFDKRVNHFQRLREAGIEIHIAMGNHDGGPKGHVLSQLPPYPFTTVIDTALRFGVERKYYYSFNRWGIHFVITDTCTDDKEAHYKWLEDDLIHHVNNPDKYPTMVFMHYPDWMTKTEGGGGPIYRVLAANPDKHTVKYAFAGHVHKLIPYPPEDTLGIPHYALHPSAPFGADQHTEYLIVTVHPDKVTFERKVVLDQGKDPDFVFPTMLGTFKPEEN